MQEKQSFYEKVYQQVMKIPKGKVASYGQIAMLAGSPRAARAVGTALHNNPLEGTIPCHRVVNAKGRLAPSFVFGGQKEQQRLLESENVQVKDGYVSMKEYRWNCR